MRFKGYGLGVVRRLMGLMGWRWGGCRGSVVVGGLDGVECRALRLRCEWRDFRCDENNDNNLNLNLN